MSRNFLVNNLGWFRRCNENITITLRCALDAGNVGQRRADEGVRWLDLAPCGGCIPRMRVSPAYELPTLPR
jgi:hypothetical protein